MALAMDFTIWPRHPPPPQIQPQAEEGAEIQEGEEVKSDETGPTNADEPQNEKQNESKSEAQNEATAVSDEVQTVTVVAPVDVAVADQMNVTSEAPSVPVDTQGTSTRRHQR